MPSITFEKEDKTINCNAGLNLRKLARKNGVELYSGLGTVLNCHGNGLCTQCEVEIVEGEQLNPRTRMEEVRLRDKPLTRRLACQVIVHGNLTVRTHPPKWSTPIPEPELSSDEGS